MAEEELTRKRRVRGGHRASATRTLGEVQPSIDSEPLDNAKISQLKRSLEEKLRFLSGLDEEILALIPEEAIEDEILRADEIKQGIYISLSKLNLILPQATPLPIDRRDPPADPPAADLPTADPPTADLPSLLPTDLQLSVPLQEPM